MADYKSNLYPGANYGLDSEYAKDNGFSDMGTGYRFAPSTFALATDPRTANQIKAVTDKLNTGAKSIEITGIQTKVLEAIPDQHLKELNRLKKLTGVDLTLHGPIVEASGIDPQNQRFEESDRMGAERQMWSAVERGQRLDPDGNIIVVFHSSAALPDLEQPFINKPGEKPEVAQMWVVNERDGKMGAIKPKENFMLNEKPNVSVELKRLNDENWTQSLSSLNFQVRQGKQAIREAFEKDEEGKPSQMFEYYKKMREGVDVFEGHSPVEKKNIEMGLSNLSYADSHIRESYVKLQSMFNDAWVAVKNSESDKKEEDMKKLEAYRDRVSKKVEEFKDPFKITELAEEVSKGIMTLNSLTEPPKIYKSLHGFAMDKSSETFANVAFNSYKKFEDKSPILSIENPPAGGAFSRAEDLKELIVKAREKFVQKAVEDGMSKNMAENQAKKLIGATWDVGHINMLRKFGYGDKELREQAKTIAPFVKHIHLSDNFGLEHTELPMGMGNVPMKAHLEELRKAHGDKLDKIKKVIETGDWYQHFQKTPIRETFAAFGSPIYPMQNAPYWNQAMNTSAGYFSGYGAMLPEQHFQTYGAGFSSLPQELGGQMGGKSRVSGNPME